MKRQLERLKGKRLVTGDANLMTKDEICINVIPNGVEVKEIGTDGKIKDLAGSGGGKDYDDLHTYLYYDDRIVSLEGQEFPVCVLITRAIINIISIYPNLNAVVKMNSTEDVFGINFGNYVTLDKFVENGSSGFNQEYLLLINGISIPKYVLPENIPSGSGFSAEDEKIYIFDLLGVEAESFVEVLKTLPTTTREEFFDLLK